MFFKLENMTMDLSDTPIENIFINDFMPIADGNFVKIYLLGYKLARESGGLRNFDFSYIADLLGLIESDVIRGIEYWIKVGILKKEELEDGSYNIIFLSLKKIYVENLYAPKLVEDTPKKITDIIDDEENAKIISTADYFYRNRLTSSQRLDICSWREVYAMPSEMIEEAIWYSTEVKKKDSPSYAEGVIRNWASNNIRTKELAQESYREFDSRVHRLMKIKNLIGLSNRAYNEVDFETVNNWFDKLNMSMELVEEACKRCINTNNPNLGYVNKILNSWYEKGIKTPDEINIKDKKETITKKTKFHNFTEVSSKLSSEEIDKIAKKKSMEFFENLGD